MATMKADVVASLRGANSRRRAPHHPVVAICLPSGV